MDMRDRWLDRVLGAVVVVVVAFACAFSAGCIEGPGPSRRWPADGRVVRPDVRMASGAGEGDTRSPEESRMASERGRGAGPVATKIEVYPLEDAVVRESMPAANFGSEQLAVGETAFGPRCERNESYLQFPLSDLVADRIERVELRLKCASGCEGQRVVVHASAEAFSESVITWVNRPRSGRRVSDARFEAEVGKFTVTRAVRQAIAAGRRRWPLILRNRSRPP